MLKRKPIMCRELVEELAPEFANGKLLDLGAGKSKYREIFEKYCDSYTAADCFEADHIDVVIDAHKTPFEDNSFDSLACLSVLEHVAKPWIVAAEIERILKPGGKCMIFVPFILPYHKDPEDYFRYTIPGLASLFPQCTVLHSGGLGGIFAHIEAAWRFNLCDPYKKHHSFIRRNIYRVVKHICDWLDRYVPWPKTMYACVWIIAEKKA